MIQVQLNEVESFTWKVLRGCQVGWENFPFGRRAEGNFYLSLVLMSHKGSILMKNLPKNKIRIGLIGYNDKMSMYFQNRR